jgi:hypothetical protein
VLNPPDGYYSILVLAALFDVVDARVSRYWQAQVSVPGEVKLAPASWFTPFYHDRLTDGDFQIREDFTRIRELLEAEFAVVP